MQDLTEVDFAEPVTAVEVLTSRLGDLRLLDTGSTHIGGTVLRGPNQLRVRFTPA